MNTLENLMASAFGGKVATKKRKMVLDVEEPTYNVFKNLAKNHNKTMGEIADKLVELLTVENTRKRESRDIRDINRDTRSLLDQ